MIYIDYILIYDLSRFYSRTSLFYFWGILVGPFGPLPHLLRSLFTSDRPRVTNGRFKHEVRIHAASNETQPGQERISS